MSLTWTAGMPRTVVPASGQLGGPDLRIPPATRSPPLVDPVTRRGASA